MGVMVVSCPDMCKVLAAFIKGSVPRDSCNTTLAQVLDPVLHKQKAAGLSDSVS